MHISGSNLEIDQVREGVPLLEGNTNTEEEQVASGLISRVGEEGFIEVHTAMSPNLPEKE